MSNPMSENTPPPEWAKKRAIELAGYTYFDAPDCHALGIIGQTSLQKGFDAFARYIAAHEEPPVDPAVVAARKLVVDTQHNYPDSPWHQNEATETLAGRRDNTLVVMAAIEGVRRGIEIGSAK